VGWRKVERGERVGEEEVGGGEGRMMGVGGHAEG